MEQGLRGSEEENGIGLMESSVLSVYIYIHHRN